MLSFFPIILFLQRSRKCSIVQEDEEEEDISSCSGREELVPPLNRRGSRSEGRLNLALQERLAESERRKPPIKEHYVPVKEQWRNAGKSSSLVESPVQIQIIKDMVPKIGTTTTTIITDSSTITIPIITSNTTTIPCPKYKTMPSPTRSIPPAGSSPLQLNEIFEEGGDVGGDSSARATPRQFVSRNQNRTSYEQRRSKFHKARTASCSSSDASDDDSEKRKKRAHKLNNSTPKPLPGRRDSHDDSSDSQEPSAGAGTGGNNNSIVTTTATVQNNTSNTNHKNDNTNTSGSNGRKNGTQGATMLGRRHKASRRRNGETRLRESQSLNRITEVQEDPAHALVVAASVVGTQGVIAPAAPKSKSIGARLLQGWNLTMKKTDTAGHISRKDTIKNSVDSIEPEKSKDNETGVSNKIVSDRSGLKKMRLIGKYFQVHKKLCIPLPGLFTKNRLYKAQSCSSLARDKINLNPENVLRCRQRAVSVIRNNSDDGDINQNDKPPRRKSSSTVVQLNNVCNELTGICAVHLGQASKCCSFC